MLSWAIKYARMGLSVIPLKPRSKEPLMDWKEFQNRRATEQEVKTWFTVAKFANIGIVTGKISNLAVIDLDGQKAVEKASLMKLSSSVISLTGRGKHLWYSLPKDGVLIQNSASKIAEGIDVRGEGGFVCAPPSIHPNGRRYRWLGHGVRTAACLPVFPCLPVAKSVGTVSVVKADKQESWLVDSLEELKNGHIHNNLVSILGRFRYHNFSIDDTYALLKPYAFEDGKPFDGLKTKIEEIWERYEATKPSIAISDSGSDESVDEFLKEEEPTEWFIDGIFAKNSIGFFAGLPESGKTWALMDLAIQTAIGGNWLGLFPVKKSKVLFIDQERARPETKRRFEALFKAAGVASADLGSLRIKRGSSIKIDLELSYNAFAKLIEERRPELIIIDSLATFHTKESSNAMEMQVVMEKLKILRDKFACSFLFVHHLNKHEFQFAKEGQEPDISLLAGSIMIPAAAETVFVVRKRLSGESVVYHCKSTMAKKINPFEFKIEDVTKGIEIKGIK